MPTPAPDRPAVDETRVFLEPVFWNAYDAIRSAFMVWARSDIKPPTYWLMQSRGSVRVSNPLRHGMTMLDDIAQPSFTLHVLVRHMDPDDMEVLTGHFFAPINTVGDGIKAGLAHEMADQLRDFAWLTGRDKAVWMMDGRFLADQCRRWMLHSRPLMPDGYWADQTGKKESTIRWWRSQARPWYQSMLASVLHSASDVLQARGVVVEE